LGFVEHPFISGANVNTPCRGYWQLQWQASLVIDIVPVQVNVIKLVGCDRLTNICRSIGWKSR